MAQFLGRNGHRAFFSNEEGSLGVILDSRVSVIVAAGDREDFEQLGPWDGGEYSETDLALADGYFAAHDNPVPEPTGRLYTVPKGVQRAAQGALASDYKASPATQYIATLLASGGQISFNELATVNAYWAAKDPFSSNHGPDSLHYGGIPAQKWAGAIVEKQGLTAATAPLSKDLQTLLAENPEAGPEFLVRVDKRDGNIDRLYRIDLDKRTYVWDQASWADLGQTEWNIWDYDRALDAGDNAEKSFNSAHIMIDPESAIRTATLFNEFGSSPLTVDDINPLESTLVAEAMSSIDWAEIDTVLTAAGLDPNDGVYTTFAVGDGVDTPEERSERASGQVRDATGKFAKMGSRVSVNGNAQQTGIISRVNPSNGTVDVKLDSGNSVTVPGKSVEGVKPVKQIIGGDNIPRVDFSGILGEPRTPISRTQGQLPGTLPALTAKDLHNIINNFPQWVTSQRDKFIPVSSPGGVSVQGRDSLDTGDGGFEDAVGRDLVTDAYDHPLLSDFFKNKHRGSRYYYPLTAAAEQHTGVCVVLLPSGDSSIHEASSEDAAHLTTVWLGTTDEVTPEEAELIREQIAAYAANATPITAATKETGTLGDEGATVVFMDKTDSLAAFQRGLLEEGSPVWAQANSVKQFPEWTPHVTLGYTDMPANGEFSEPDMTFDRIAFWYGNDRQTFALGEPALVAATEPAQPMTPNTSDVQPVYMAVVSPDDPRAVFDLISLVPANSKSPQPVAYTRQDGKWVRDDQMFANLKSTTPPPVVPLDEATLDDVLIQVDEAQGANEEATPPEQIQVGTEPDPVTASGNLDLMVLWGPNPDIMLQALVAAGGLDRNRGGAEKLRRYWLHGEGAAKIRWGTPGDWTRCVRNLTKYMGPRARGYCALRHKEATGMWTGDKKHREMYASNTPTKVFSTNLLKSTEVVMDEHLANIRRAITASGVDDKRYDEYDTSTLTGLTAAANAVEYVEPQGGAFFIPLALPETIESGDGRSVQKYATDIRDLPISLLWQIHTGEGHNGAVVVGRIERLGRTGRGIGAGYGHFDTGEYGREAERMVREGMLRFVSADMDNFEAEAEENTLADAGKIGKNKLSINKARVMAVTIVAKPAFQECTIEMVPEPITEELDVLPEGIYAEEPDPIDALALVAAGYIAEAVPVVPPRAWFDNPQLSGPTPLNVDDDGRVFGHVAAWNTAHISPHLRGIEPPRSKSNYAFFNTGVIRTDNGSDVTVGQLTLSGGHADLHFSAKEAVKHYDDTASAIADVHAGEDEFGIWVAGALRPGVTPEQVRIFRASAPSGDWRPIRGNLELVAVCQVNVPGFPQARAFTASGGHTMAIVAAGASVLAHMRPDPINMLSARLEALEQRHDMAEEDTTAALVASLMARVAPSREAYDAELSAKADAAIERMQSFGFVSKQARDKAAQEGEALPDGSYPIRNETDLKNAIQSFGRAKDSDRNKVRRHIIKRARALGKFDLIPEEWKHADQAALEASLNSVRERADAAQREFSEAQALVAAANDDDERRKKEREALKQIDKPLEQMTPADKARAINLLRSKGLEVPKGLAPEPTAEVPGVDENGRPKYKPGYQPRDYNGRFRLVLARLKENLGVSGNQDVVEELEAADSATRAGDYVKSVRAGLDLTNKLERLDEGALNKEAIGNVRLTARDLATTISNLPLPFKNQAQKVRFSDLPPNLRDLMDEMVDRVNEKIGAKEGAVATANIRQLMTGADMFSQADISREMSKLLRLLT